MALLRAAAAPLPSRPASRRPPPLASGPAAWPVRLRRLVLAVPLSPGLARGTEAAGSPHRPHPSPDLPSKSRPHMGPREEKRARPSSSPAGGDPDSGRGRVLPGPARCSRPGKFRAGEPPSRPRFSFNKSRVCSQLCFCPLRETPRPGRARKSLQGEAAPGLLTQGLPLQTLPRGPGIFLAPRVDASIHPVGSCGKGLCAWLL
nr:PREDICTED: translation initiation factor IF-2-like [Macaca fascicularis]